MIQRTAVATLGALLLVASSGVAWAIPTTLTVQGHLTNAAGQAADGDYVLRLSLYDAPTGGDTVWTQLYEVDVADGVFDAALGDDPLNPLQAATFVNANQLWLGIQVTSGPGVPDGGDAELPRGPLTTVGYAFAAQHAATADSATTATTATTADSATTAATADVANAVDCNACVGTVQLAFDPATQTELDQALANIQFPTSVDGLGGGIIDGDVTVQGVLTAGALTQGDQPVCDASGNCGGAGVVGACPEGQAITAINADGSYTCGATGGALPADGLNEVSNDLLTNQFVDVFTSANAPVPIPDAFGPGVSDTITVADVGTAQALSVSVNISNGNLAVVTVRLFAPNGDEYVLFDKDNPGSQLGATYPNPNPTLSGDLTTWVGQNPAGAWVLNVQDQDGLGNQDDGQINDWSISIQTLSTKKVQVAGDLSMSGDVDMNGGKVTNMGAPSAATDATNMEWVDTRIDEKIAAIDPSTYTRSGTVLTRWGSPTCPGGFEKFYDGVAWAAHHQHQGSGDIHCIIPPGQGGTSGPGTTSGADLLYPMRVDHQSGTGIPQGPAIRCSRCYTPDRAPCWRLVGGNTCPGDFEAVYSGFLFGQHYQHANSTERICIGTEDFDTSQGDTGDYMYVSNLHDNGGVGDLYPNTGGAIHCAWCCRP